MYRNISPYELPAEHTRYQAQDMGKVGAIQDLIHGVQKLVKRKGNNYQTGLKQQERDLMNQLEKNQKNTKLYISGAIVFLLTFLGLVMWASSTRFDKLFYSPKGCVSIFGLPGPSILDLPLLYLLIPLLYDIGIICNIMQGFVGSLCNDCLVSIG